MKIELFSKGGQYPYQAEGIINDKDYFYYRARHGQVSLDLCNTKEELDKLSFVNEKYISIDKNSFVTDEEALQDIETLYNLINK